MTHRRCQLEAVSFSGARALSRTQEAELIAVGIGHDHPINVTLTDVDSSRSQFDETTYRRKERAQPRRRSR